MSRVFDKFFVAVDVGTNRKLRRLPVAHRWVYVAGVLALAAQSPIRGALLIADGEPATDDDVAMQATVSAKDARAAMTALRRLGMLDRDAHGVEWVHDWDRMNPDPKPSDSPLATRERKRQQRAKARAGHADVTRDMALCHAPEVEVEGEEEHPPLTPHGGERDLPTVPARRTGGRKRDHDVHDAEVSAYSAAHFPSLDPDIAVGLVRGAIAQGCRTHESIAAYVKRWTTTDDNRQVA